MKHVFRTLTVISLISLLTACSYQSTIGIDVAFTVNNDQCTMDKDVVLRIMEEFSANTESIEKAINTIEIKSCKVDKKSADVELAYDKKLMNQAGFKLIDEFTINFE